MITACLGLIKSTTSHYDGGAVSVDSEKEFYRLQGDLYSLCRIKASCCTSVIRLLICLAYCCYVLSFECSAFMPVIKDLIFLA